MFRLTLLLAFALTPSIASAADWSTTFEASAVASHLEGRHAFVVVGFGPGGDDASNALSAALESSGRAELCIPGANLGALDGLDDPSVVKKAAAFPVQRVAIARVFGERVVVTVFRIDGTAVAALSGSKGTPIKSKEARATDGVEGSTAAAVANVTRGDDAKAAREKYDRQFIGIEEIVAVSGGGAVVANNATYFRGKYKEPLDLPQVFEAMGDPGTAKKVRDHSATKVALFVGGLVGTYGLPFLGLVPFAFAPPRPDFVSCFNQPNVAQCEQARDAREDAYKRGQQNATAAGLAIGIPLFVAGVVVFFSGFTMKPLPIELSEIRERIDQHNRKLRQELGLSDELSETEPTPQRAPELQAGFVPMQGGGAFSLQVRF